jgi:N-acetylmuramoyl-L-alanine amidase
MKILLISGHGAGDPGTSSKFGVEATETIIMVKKIQQTLKNYATVDLYPTDRNAYKDINNKCLKVKFSDYDYVFEVHFNSGAKDLVGDKETTGTEIYVTTLEKTTGVEQRIVNSIAALGLHNRGVKKNNWTVIYTAKKAGVSSALLEVCFIDDKDDMAIYTKKKDKIAEAIALAIAEQFGLKKTTTKEVKVGSVVTIKDGAVYGGLSSTRGKAVPASQRNGKKHTVDKIQTNKGVKEARLKDIMSWVAVKSLNVL